MNTFSQLFAFACFFLFLACVLYIVFGQVTVRKLRKNPKTKAVMGIEYASGWDIINVAQALALPRSWSRKLKKSPLSYLYANSELLFENTTKFDQVLAAVFFWLLTLSGLAAALLLLLNTLGLFG
ncbi:hypothetical protein SG34_023375 [Thalassomonas viridans]|uniref:Uncharacterized protein n=1 Tax=Thalassomonas viridans TaxID=137584 RepID=A0AAE9Z124_9GAMM|nr:hypothetical protein [Thalassomonas viridans]WDE04252.1 hypothetical protein SG34_023375 [Thalassomonas viridans]